MHGFSRLGTRRLGWFLTALAASTWFLPLDAQASKIVLDTGRVLEGKLNRLPSIANFKTPPPAEGAPLPRLIVMCDDGLRRYFVPARRVKDVLEGEGEVTIRFDVKQPAHGQSGRVANLGPILKITPFDEFGRRIFTMATDKGPLDLIQGITVITPTWTQVDGLKHQWEMRIATTSIPRDILKKILAKVINPKNSDHRVKVAQLFIQMELYADARAELKQIIQDFPDLADRVEPVERSLTQLHARRILDEIRVRADADQHQLAYSMLRQFPVDGISGEILASVRGLREEYDNDNNRAITARKLFDELLALVPDDERRQVLPARDELFARRSQLEPEEISDWLTFASTLGQQALAFDKGGAEADRKVIPSPGRRLVECFTEEARQALFTVTRTGQMGIDEQRLFFDSLRTAMRRADLYTTDDFGEVVVTEEAQLLIKRDSKSLSKEEVLRLNRLLLEASYPALIAKSQFTGLTMNTLVHLEAFLQFATQREVQPGEKALTPSEKLALAISGWALGSNSAVQSLPVALSVWRTRTLVRLYLKETTVLRRQALLSEIQSQEGSSPDTIAKLLANLPPPMETPSQYISGFFEIDVPGVGDAPPTKYFVQLPPEYDPQGRYPTIIGLNGLGSVAAHSAINKPNAVDAGKPSMIDWWAGSPDADGIRRGQSMRHGYIVIAPDWSSPAQKEYQFSAREHEAVLSALRDACRRFAVDTDRVYLSGHSMGGDAAWDIGLSHPDLWAGVVPIIATTTKYTSLYFENARHTPFYVVGGELDSDNSIKNGRDLDRYMSRGFDITFAEFQGRGHENFSDEILNIFDWMKRRKREPNLKEFSMKTIRPWDNFFWWAEIESFPEKGVCLQWPPKDKRALEVECSIKTTEGPMAANNIRVKSGAGRTTIWLSPRLIDFDKKTIINVDGVRVNKNPYVKPEIETILEDARTRGDRQHPYWVKLEF
jgi:predicted esterase